MFKKLRKGADKPPAKPTAADSIEAMRRRARHRLIGAVVLVLVAVVGFPILFDTQPRPVAVDIPIEIPDRNKAKPLPPLAAPPAQSTPTAPAAAVAKVTPESAIITETRQEAGAPVAPAVPATPAPARTAASESKPAAAKPETAVAEKKPEPKPETKVEPKAAAVDEAAKARALLEGKPVETVAAAGERFVVQVGAFAETDKARQAQVKLQRAGLKNYTNVAETKDGKRIRVRAGPFASRAEAAEAAEKIKGLDLPAAILTL